MPSTLDAERLRDADPARDAAPSDAARLRVHARLSTAIAGESAAHRRRRPVSTRPAAGRAARILRRRLLPAGAMAAAAAVAVAVGTGGGPGAVAPAAAFAQAFEGDGVVRMTLVERVQEGDRERPGARTQLWLSREDGSWRTRRTFRGATTEQRWDASTGSYVVDGQRVDGDLAGRLDYAPLPRVFDPLRARRGVPGARDEELTEAATATVGGERLHELTLARPPADLDLRWWVTDDGTPRRFVVGMGDSALVTDVTGYEADGRG